MSGKFLLDTNILIAYFSGEEAVSERVRNTDSLLIPAIVIGELYYGAFNSGRPTENSGRIDSLVNNVPIIACNETTGRFYGQIKSQLKQKGTPIPENDIWIAALSMQTQIPLVSRDAHFKHIAGLDLEVW